MAALGSALRGRVCLRAAGVISTPVQWPSSGGIPANNYQSVGTQGTHIRDTTRVPAAAAAGPARMTAADDDTGDPDRDVAVAAGRELCDVQ